MSKPTTALLTTICDTATLGAVLLVHPPLPQDPHRFARVARRTVTASGAPRTDLLRVRVTAVRADQMRGTALEIEQAIRDGWRPTRMLECVAC